MTVQVQIPSLRIPTKNSLGDTAGADPLTRNSQQELPGCSFWYRSPHSEFPPRIPWQQMKIPTQNSH